VSHPPSPLPEPSERSLSAAPDRGGARRARSAHDIDDLVELLRSDVEVGANFSRWRVSPPRAARVRAWPAALSPRLVELYRARGVEQPYAHQAEAIEAALAGRDVLVTTPTASGKTLCYTVPVLEALLSTNGRARALWMFPTKALSQDQSANLNALIAALGEPWHSFTYDGDTSPSIRRTLRERGQVVLTNPWMLHAGILPHHPKWADLFRNLEYIVIDEVHTLSGVFGSNVAGVLRRLLRICAHYGSRPRFLLSSATLHDPAGHALALTGRTAVVVDADGSPSGERHFAVYNPPMLNPVAGLRANALEEARRLASRVCGPRHQTIFFTQRRTAVEVLTRYLKEAAPSLGLRPEEVRGYRGGYLPDLRREIEQGLRRGEVKVVVSTNALELGIDIGALDVAVLVGYPGSQASFWQRAGRVGRRARSSLVVLIARSDPVDQYLAAHPEYLYSAPRERLALDPDNLVLLAEQLKCAAFEVPFRAEADGSVRGFGASPHVPAILDYLAEESQLLQKKDRTWYWIADAYPAHHVSLSGNEPDNVLVLDAETDKAIGEIDREGSLTAVHDGAIYQVEGRTWKIERFDYANRRAYAREVDTDYYTEAETDTDLRVLRLEQCAARALESADGARPDYAIFRGEVHVTTQATNFKKVRFYTRENVGADDIHLPAEEIDTEAFVLVLEEHVARELELDGACWHGVGMLVRRVAPLYLRCQSQDLGLSAQIRSAHFARPSLFLYDRMHGGAGLSSIVFRAHRELLGAALEVVRACPCRGGCPACVGPADEVGPLGKQGALRVLEHLVEGPAPREASIEAHASRGDT
jgi:DEAD/DEAH box helicase domain-containing protein